MTQEDLKIKQLFFESLPELSSDSLFMERIKGAVKAQEFLKTKERILKYQSRRAAFVSGVAGFMCGILMSWLYPHILLFFNSLLINFGNLSLPRDSMSEIFSWISVSLCCVITVFSTYAMTLNFSWAFLRHKKTTPRSGVG